MFSTLVALPGDLQITVVFFAGLAIGAFWGVVIAKLWQVESLTKSDVTAPSAIGTTRGTTAS